MGSPEAGRSLSHDSRSQFTDYLSSSSLPAKDASIRSIGVADLTMALVEHAPNAGIWFDPIDDVVISVVVRAGHSRVVRNVGHGHVEFTDAPGIVLLSPADRASYWRFEGCPLVLHLSMPRQRFPALQESARAGLDGRSAGLPCKDPLVAQLAARMWEFGAALDEGARGIVENGLPTMLALLARSLEPTDRGPQPQRSRMSALSPTRLRKVRQVMSDQRQPASVTELADAVALSRTHFAKSFKAATGRSPYRAASELRIEEAKRLLSHRNLSMTDIAFELGFSSSAHFSSRFKQLTGMSPTGWRATYCS